MASPTRSSGKPLGDVFSMLKELSKTPGSHGIIAKNMSNEGILVNTVQQSDVVSVGTIVLDTYTASDNAINKVHVIPGKNTSTNAFAAGFLANDMKTKGSAVVTVDADKTPAHNTHLASTPPLTSSMGMEVDVERIKAKVNERLKILKGRDNDTPLEEFFRPFLTKLIKRIKDPDVVAAELYALNETLNSYQVELVTGQKTTFDKNNKICSYVIKNDNIDSFLEALNNTGNVGVLKLIEEMASLEL